MRLKKPLVIVPLILLITAGLYHQQVKPRCVILGNNSFGQNSGFNNTNVIALAHALGAKDPVKACWGGLSNATGVDGPHAAVRIGGTQSVALVKARCPARPRSDTSNAGWVGIAHADFGNHDRITNYYSPEGKTCTGNGKVNIILTGKDRLGKNVVYVVFYGG